MPCNVTHLHPMRIKIQKKKKKIFSLNVINLELLKGHQETLFFFQSTYIILNQTDANKVQQEERLRWFWRYLREVTNAICHDGFETVTAPFHVVVVVVSPLLALSISLYMILSSYNRSKSLRNSSFNTTIYEEKE